MMNYTLCYLENEKQEYLMLHRVKKKNDINHDKWIGVGGKFEEGESPEDCVLRETLEETGLTLTDYRFRGIVTFDCEGLETQYLHLFTATGWTGEMAECSEGDLEWVEKKAVYSLPIWEGDRIFFRLLENPDQPFFSLKMCYDAGNRLTYAALDGRELPLREKLLVSACLLGQPCRYAGGSNAIPEAEALGARYELIPVCPEQLGGLPTPRIPAERVGDKVLSRTGADVTAAFRAGAERALEAAQGAGKALLKERSPSCGCTCIYDGSFTGQVIPGQGVTAELLARHGIKLYGESQVDELLRP